MAVTRDDVIRVAGLARLRLDEERTASLVAQLNGILDHMAVLAGVPTEGVQGAAGVGDAGLPLRADAGPPIPLERPPQALAPRLPDGSPAARDGYFLVPRLSTHEGAERPVPEAPEP